MEQEYFKILGTLSTAEQKSPIDYLLGLTDFVSAELRKLKIFKFVLVLNKFSLETDSVKADSVNSRHYQKSMQLSYLGTELKVEVTGVNTEESVITIVQFRNSDLSQNLFHQIRTLFDAQLAPSHLKTLHSESSIYLICTYSVTGQIWKIHRDKLKYKAHLPLTECNDSLIWYDDPTQKTELQKLSFDKNVFYLLLVEEYHTVNVTGYIQDTPRIHLVADLEEL